MNYIKKIIVFIYYLLIFLNNIKINFFKFNLIYYLDLSKISNKNLNTIVNFKITIILKVINCK